MMALTETPIGVEKKLSEVLARIWDNHEFILGTRLFLQTDEERQSLIDAVVAEKIKNPSDILLFAYDIHKEREGAVTKLSFSTHLSVTAP
ncbi:hypothetical protein, partial [Megasphaera massiliensis]